MQSLHGITFLHQPHTPLSSAPSLPHPAWLTGPQHTNATPPPTHTGLRVSHRRARHSRLCVCCVRPDPEAAVHWVQQGAEGQPQDSAGTPARQGLLLQVSAVLHLRQHIGGAAREGVCCPACSCGQHLVIVCACHGSPMHIITSTTTTDCLLIVPAPSQFSTQINTPPGLSTCHPLTRTPCWQFDRPGLRSVGRHHLATNWHLSARLGRFVIDWCVVRAGGFCGDVVNVKHAFTCSGNWPDLCYSLEIDCA